MKQMRLSEINNHMAQRKMMLSSKAHKEGAKMPLKKSLKKGGMVR